MDQTNWMLVALAAVALSGSQPARSEEPEPRPDLSGTWVLNEELSEDPREKMQEAMSERGRGGGFSARGGAGGFGGRGGGGGFGSRGGGGGTRGRGDSADDKMRARAEAYETLTIQHQDPELLITLADDHQQELFTDGRKVETWRGTESAKWQKDGALTVTTKSEQGKRKTSWQLSEDSSRLTLTSELPGRGPMPSITFDRVYDRANKSQPSD